MVKRTISQSSKKPITKMRSIVFGLTLLVIILISALIISSYRISPVEAEVGLAFIITDTPNDIATQESIMTRFVTETAVAFATESVRNRLATNEYAALQTSAALATASANNQTATIEFVVAQTDVALATSLQTTLNIELTDTQGTRIVLSATAMPSPTPNLSETRTAEARQQERALIDAQATVSVQQTQTVQAIPDSPQVIVDVSNANVRSGPGSDYSVVGSASQGHIFEAVAYYDDSSGTRWYQIAWDGVSQAWIQERVVTYASNSVSLALASSIPATPQNVVAATGSPNSDSIPSILSVSYDGTCIEHTTTIDWDDPDGDALRIELVDINNGSIYGSYSVQGKSGTAQYNSTCVSGVVSCFTNVRIVDHAGNVSPIFFSTLACTQ